MSKLLEETTKSVQRLQNFNADQLVRREELGRFSFDDAIDPASRLINFFRQIPLEHLGELTENHLISLRDQANAIYNLFESILKFDPVSDASPAGTRTSYLQQLRDNYSSTFNNLHVLISYLSSRQHDFGALAREARAAVQVATDQTEQLKSNLIEAQLEADRILTEVRKVAAEQGVSQQAIYFSKEAEEHERLAKDWQRRTVLIAAGLGLAAALSVGVHKISYLSPNNMYDSIQLAISKALLLGVIAYMLVLYSRNFMAHKHNAVINRHRQNALLTFNALAEASKSDDRRDIILSHAAACIFSPQDTGYTKSHQATDTPVTKLIEILPKSGAASS